MRHKVEVDQSIKIEDTGATVLAFANGIAAAVVIPGKRQASCADALAAAESKPETGRMSHRLFAAGLVLVAAGSS